MKKFGAFIAQHYHGGGLESIEQIIIKIKKGKIDVYDLLGRFVLYLKEKNGNSPVTLKNYVITIKNFFEYSDIDISPKKFKLKEGCQKLLEAIKKHYQRKMLLIF